MILFYYMFYYKFTSSYIYLTIDGYRICNMCGKLKVTIKIGCYIVPEANFRTSCYHFSSLKDKKVYRIVFLSMFDFSKFVAIPISKESNESSELNSSMSLLEDIIRQTNDTRSHIL